MRRGHRAAERVPRVWPGPGLGQDQPPGPAAGLHHGHVRLKWDGHTVQVQAGLYVVLLAVDDKLHWTFKLYDVDGNGEIDFAEWCAATINKNELFCDENLREAFEFFDNDNSGTIDANEIC